MTLGGTMRPGRAQRIPFQTGGAWPALRRSMMRFLTLACVAASLIAGRALAIQLSDLAGTWLHASVEVDGNAITDDHFYINKISGIPTIDIIEMDPGSDTGFGRYWHTHRDDLSVIDKTTLHAVGHTLLYTLFQE